MSILVNVHKIIRVILVKLLSGVAFLQELSFDVKL